MKVLILSLFKDPPNASQHTAVAIVPEPQLHGRTGVETRRAGRPLRFVSETLRQWPPLSPPKATAPEGSNTDLARLPRQECRDSARLHLPKQGSDAQSLWQNFSGSRAESSVIRTGPASSHWNNAKKYQTVSGVQDRAKKLVSSAHCGCPGWKRFHADNGNSQRGRNSQSRANPDSETGKGTRTRGNGNPSQIGGRHISLFQEMSDSFERGSQRTSGGSERLRIQPCLHRRPAQPNRLHPQYRFPRSETNEHTPHRPCWVFLRGISLILGQIIS